MNYSIWMKNKWYGQDYSLRSKSFRRNFISPKDWRISLKPFLFSEEEEEELLAQETILQKAWWWCFGIKEKSWGVFEKFVCIFFEFDYVRWKKGVYCWRFIYRSFLFRIRKFGCRQREEGVFVLVSSFTWWWWVANGGV